MICPGSYHHQHANDHYQDKLQNGQSCKIMCDVLIRTGVGEPSHSRNIPNSKVSRGLLGTTAKLGTMRSCVIEIEAQFAADILLSRPLSGPYVTPILLLVVWPPVSSRLEPVMLIVVVVIGTPDATRTHPVTTEI